MNFTSSATPVFRRALILSLLASAPLLLAEAPQPPTAPSLDAIDASIRRGVDFLVAHQNPNGSWGGPTRTKGLNIAADVPGAHYAFMAATTGLAIEASAAAPAGRTGAGAAGPPSPGATTRAAVQDAIIGRGP